MKMPHFATIAIVAIAYIIGARYPAIAKKIGAA